jgi:signal transduction histidine kinase/DNA-binding response OmpR family regulator/HAMP domain-containing protein
LEICERETRAASIAVSANADISIAVEERNTAQLLNLLNATLALNYVNFYTVTDANGIVLARTHAPETYGDSAMFLHNIREALDGNIITCYEEGDLIKISIRTGSPVYNAAGQLIGTISAGVRLDTNEAADDLKEHFLTEFSIFYGDVRIATSIKKDGERIVGTRLDREVAEKVIGGKTEYIGNADIFGENYSAYYMPLINHYDEIYAILSAGNPNTQLYKERNNLIINGGLIGLIGLAISIVILMVITTRIIMPVDDTIRLISEVARGNVNVDTGGSNFASDEIGHLTFDVYMLIDVIKSLVGDLSQLIFKIKDYSDNDIQIDAGKYSGAYKEIIAGINTLVSSMHTMNKVMTAMDNIDNMVIIIDLDFNMIYINRSLADTFGVDINNYKGMKCHKEIRNLDQPCSICLLPEMICDKDSFPSREYNFLYDDITKNYLGGRSSIIRWIDGSVVYFQSLVNENMRKKAQEQLSDAVLEAETASMAKSAFLAKMSHELRTPLNVVIGLSDLQLDDREIADSIRDNLYKINYAGNTLLSIVNDILDISKIESGEFVLSPVEYRMESLLNDTATLIIARIGEKPIVFRLYVDENLYSKLYGDDLRVKQIMINLLNNAVKYTHEGYVELTVQCALENSGDARPGVRPDNRPGVWMDIYVKDSGIGIRAEDLADLFSEFKQVDNRANRVIEGTGLGLAITKKLVESMGGTISVESEYGKGSVFRARIRQGYVEDMGIGPIVVDNFNKSQFGANKRRYAGKLVRDNLYYAKVLVVDDLQNNLDVAAGLMRKYNMQVDCVTSGRLAIKRILDGEPVYSAIFMDHMMPEMDGIETAKMIRAIGNEYAMNIPIIALTANAVVGTDEMFFNNGFQAFISKPIDIMQLDYVIQQFVKDNSKNEILPLDGIAGGEADAAGDGVGDEEGADLKRFSTDTPAPQTGAEKTTINIQGIEADNGLIVCDGDIKIYKSILRSYLADMPAVIAVMRDVSAETLQSYTIAVHGLKGSSANIGAESIRKESARMESMAASGDLEGVLTDNGALIRNAETLAANIKDWFSNQDADTVISKPLLAELDRDLLSELRRHCDMFDYDSADKIMEVLEAAHYVSSSDNDFVGWLRNKVDLFEFDVITERLTEY